MQWRAAVAERPDFKPGWRGLGDLALSAGRWAEVDEIADRLAGVEGLALRARSRLGCKDFEAARDLVQQAIAEAPTALFPREILSHVLLQEGTNWDAAERALHDVLALAPNVLCG